MFNFDVFAKFATKKIHTQYTGEKCFLFINKINHSYEFLFKNIYLKMNINRSNNEKNVATLSIVFSMTT